MKRFLLFHGLHYYADGGWNDFGGSFASLEEAITHFKSLPPFGNDRIDWAHIVDTDIAPTSDSDLMIVWEFGGGGGS